MDNKQNAKYAFYYLLSLVSLIFMTISAGLVIFSIIDKSIVDVLSRQMSLDDSQLKFAISSLIITVPIYYLIGHLIDKGLRRQELKSDSGLRRYLTYFILLVSAIIVLGVLISLINVFLAGELTTSFILKALTVFIISSIVFSFYFYDIKRKIVTESRGLFRVFSVGSLILLIIIFISAWFFIEPPKVSRARRLDQKLMDNVYNLDQAVSDYYSQKKELPANIKVLIANPNFYLDVDNLVDPETKVPLVYKKMGSKKFEICATFRLSTEQESNIERPTGVKYLLNNEKHSAGYQCLTGHLYGVFENSSN